MTDKATHMEAQFRGLAKTSDSSGDWFKIVLWVHPDDCPDELFRVKLRSRLGVAMVQIADDETETPVKKAFKDLPPSQQAGIRCGDPVFQNWCRDHNPGFFDCVGVTVADFVRSYCEVESRAELNQNPAEWISLNAQFEADTRLPEQR